MTILYGWNGDETVKAEEFWILLYIVTEINMYYLYSVEENL